MNKYSIMQITDESIWNDALSQISNKTIYSSWSWGEYKRKSGWDIQRISVENTKDKYAFAQIQIKKLPIMGTRAIFVQGGILFKDDEGVVDYQGLIKVIQDHLELGKYDIVIVETVSVVQKFVPDLLELGYQPFVMADGYTFMLDIKPASDELERGLSRNWRHNLKRARKNNLQVRIIGDDKDERERAICHLEGMYAYLNERKGFNQAINFSFFKPVAIRDLDYKIIEILLDGKVIATRVGYVKDKSALDFLAASSHEAKNNYATYLALWELIVLSKNLGAEKFDCGGIDPHSNKGVYAFKKGMKGGLHLSRVTWVYSGSSLLKHLYRHKFL